MASIGNDAGGKKRILFVAPEGSRKTIRLGKCSKRDAEKIKTRVESLLSCKVLGTPISQDDAKWVASIEKELRTRFERAGLLEPTEEEKQAKKRKTVEQHLEEYVARNGGSKKAATVFIWRQVFTDLNRELPKGIYLDEVTKGHAKSFHEALKKRLAVTTVDKRIRFARQFFKDAVDWELIEKNPFEGIKTTTASTKSNVIVDRKTIERVLEHCDPCWRIIVALSRFGGLRCPSEVLSLKWEHIDWANNRMYIPEPKVEHHEGRGVRECPIFEDLAPYLTEAFEVARDGAEYVVDSATYRTAAQGQNGWMNANLRQQFGRILTRAGVKPWKRLFHSMRATRQTELEKEHPIHVVCSWLGNSIRIAQKNYLLVSDDDFERAAGIAAQNPAQLDAKVAQNPAQQEARTEPHQHKKTLETVGKNADSQGFDSPTKRRGQDLNLRTSVNRSLH